MAREIFVQPRTAASGFVQAISSCIFTMGASNDFRLKTCPRTGSPGLSLWLWLVTEYGLVHLQNGNFTIVNRNPAAPDGTVMPSEFVLTTFENRTGSLRF